MTHDRTCRTENVRWKVSMLGVSCNGSMTPAVKSQVPDAVPAELSDRQISFLKIPHNESKRKADAERTHLHRKKVNRSAFKLFLYA